MAARVIILVKSCTHRMVFYLVLFCNTLQAVLLVLFCPLLDFAMATQRMVYADVEPSVERDMTTTNGIIVRILYLGRIEHHEYIK